MVVVNISPSEHISNKKFVLDKWSSFSDYFRLLTALNVEFVILLSRDCTMLKLTRRVKLKQCLSISWLTLQLASYMLALEFLCSELRYSFAGLKLVGGSYYSMEL